MQNKHIPVLLKETLAHLQPRKGQWYIDATFGRGGHTAALLETGAHVIAFDWDGEAIAFGTSAFAKQLETKQLILINESFSTIATQVHSLQKSNPDIRIEGILFDFGTSSNQLTSVERGFSFAGEGQLDMRMDSRLGVTAKDILAVVPEKQLAELFAEYGGEDEAKSIAKAIKASKTPITTTAQLSTLIVSVKKRTRPGIHPATKVFQALRIAVNSELDEIAAALPGSLSVLNPGGLLVAISFHDGEDRIIKQQFKAWESNKQGEVLTSKPIEASTSELEENNRARSAKLRVFRKKL